MPYGRHAVVRKQLNDTIQQRAGSLRFFSGSGTAAEALTSTCQLSSCTQVDGFDHKFAPPSRNDLIDAPGWPQWVHEGP